MNKQVFSGTKIGQNHKNHHPKFSSFFPAFSFLPALIPTTGFVFCFTYVSWSLDRTRRRCRPTVSLVFNKVVRNCGRKVHLGPGIWVGVDCTVFWTDNDWLAFARSDFLESVVPVVLIVVRDVCFVLSGLSFPAESLRRRWLDWLSWSTLFPVEGLSVAAVAVHGGALWGGD